MFVDAEQALVQATAPAKKPVRRAVLVGCCVMAFALAYVLCSSVFAAPSTRAINFEFACRDQADQTAALCRTCDLTTGEWQACV
mmetsp:Transcript_25679/g.80045  ORF Transcript_25679/g.80045 Transcript_25679/m.80045 type:complete len:84 (-) Transcript_25679:84-335(-)